MLIGLIQSPTTKKQGKPSKAKIAVYECGMRFINGEYQDKKGLPVGDAETSYAGCNCMFGCSKCGWGNNHG